MRIELAYGKSSLSVDLPDNREIIVVEPKFVPALSDPPAALQDCLKDPLGLPPLSETPSDTKVGIIFSDITRPTPNDVILPVLLDQLAHIPRENITLFNALGTHRPNTDIELRGMLGDELVENYRIVQNNAFEPETQICLGVSNLGHEVWINREVIECDLRVLTGFIEPHFFAGFSGGGKAIMPGMAGQRTVFGNHDAGMITSPKATWGVNSENPIFDEIREVVRMAGACFLMNVTLNRDKEITGVFSGDLELAHNAGCDFIRQSAMVPVQALFDIVITTNSGYPLDLNLYQAVKGMSAAAQIVKSGGTIIIAADCWDGIPDHGLFSQLLKEAESPQALLKTIHSPGFLKQDQWQAQILAQLLLKAKIYLRTDNLSREDVEGAMLQYSSSIEETLEKELERLGSGARLCVLPEGPQTIPYLKSE
jgi:lactate racemase